MELTAIQVLEALSDPTSPHRVEVERRLRDATAGYDQMGDLAREQYLGEMQRVQQRFLRKWADER